MLDSSYRNHNDMSGGQEASSTALIDSWVNAGRHGFMASPMLPQSRGSLLSNNFDLFWFAIDDVQPVHLVQNYRWP